MSQIISIKRRTSIARLECSTCGATADAACNCGAPYVRAGSRAAQAIAANPEKSNRMIAEETRISEPTIRRARKSTASNDAVGRKGKDGKVRKLPRRPEPQIADPAKEINAFHRELVDFLDDFTRRFNKWHDGGPLVDKNGKQALMQAFYLCADGFAQLAQVFDGR
jgi:hypothetical protein